MRLNQMIVVIDEDIEFGQLIKKLLADTEYTVIQYLYESEALSAIKKKPPQLLITKYPVKKYQANNFDGLSFLEQIQTKFPEVTIIQTTAALTAVLTTTAIDIPCDETVTKACHYRIEPSVNGELIFQIKQAMQKRNLHCETSDLKPEEDPCCGFGSIIGKSPALLDIFNLIKIVALSSANVLITGESGTGKELVAQALHNSGSRKNKLFVPLNCTAIPEQLLESELFGHTKGSFTGAINDKKGLFEEADGGTIFLDEIGDLSLNLQAKLLRVLQDKQIRAVGATRFKQINVRIISATHQELQGLVKDGKFREDLFYRLNVIPIRVPPLRERKEDIQLLTESFIRKFALQNNSPVKGISSAAMVNLMTYSWPGNVRELQNVIERAIVLSTDEVLEKTILLDSRLETTESNLTALQNDRPTLEKLEERYIKKILGEVSNKKNEAAQVLGISRRTLYRKERIYGLTTEDSDKLEEDCCVQFH